MDIKKTYKLSNEQFLTKCFELVNCMQSNQKKRLTDAEIKIITEFLSLDSTYEHDRFSIRSKRQVIKNLETKGWKIVNHGINIHLSHLKQKGVITDTPDKVKRLHPKLNEAFKNKKLTFTFELNND